MGHRGYRRYRFRCAYVDPDTELRCRVQVKRAGSKYCCRAHAWAAQRGVTPAVQPQSSKARYKMARAEELADLRRVLDGAAVNGLVHAAGVVAVLAKRYDRIYGRGYTAGHEKATATAKRLKLETSKQMLSTFTASKVGKVFTRGDIGHDALADFHFGLGR